MQFLLEIGIFQPAMLVYQSVHVKSHNSLKGAVGNKAKSLRRAKDRDESQKGVEFFFGAKLPAVGKEHVET